MPSNQITDLDNCCTNLTITSNGWSNYAEGHQLWGDYTKHGIQNGRNVYKYNSPYNEKYLYWNKKKWVVS